MTFSDVYHSPAAGPVEISIYILHSQRTYTQVRLTAGDRCTCRRHADMSTYLSPACLPTLITSIHLRLQQNLLFSPVNSGLTCKTSRHDRTKLDQAVNQEIFQVA